MSRLTYPDYLSHIRRESTVFRDVLADCDPTAVVPSCPAWTAADLLWHLTEVQHWWCAVMTDRPAYPEDTGYEDPVRPASYADLLAAYDQAHQAFADALADADPSQPAWSWSPDPGDQTVAFTYRRQAHEALIHRLDAELAAGGRVTDVDPALAADGVDEVLDVMYGGLPPWSTFDPLPHYVEFRMTDAGSSVWTQLGLLYGTTPEGQEVSAESCLRVVETPAGEADAVVHGTAADLDVWLWRRRDDEGITVTGDRGAYGRARALLDTPID